MDSIGLNPEVLNNFYKTLSGVSASADPNNHIVISFAWAPNSSTYGMNRIRTFNCQVTAGDLEQVSIAYTSETTRIQPALTYDSNADRFIMTWRGQNSSTTLSSMNKSWTNPNWSGKVDLLGNSSHVAPALTSSPEYGESVMWYAYEGS